MANCCENYRPRLITSGRYTESGKDGGHCGRHSIDLCESCGTFHVMTMKDNVWINHTFSIWSLDSLRAAAIPYNSIAESEGLEKLSF